MQEDRFPSSHAVVRTLPTVELSVRRGWWAGAIALVIVSAGAILYFIGKRGTQPSGTAAATHVDPAPCAGCHAKIAETYRLTGMGRSFYLPTRDNTIGESKKPVSFYHKASDSYFTMSERDGHFYQRRYQIGFDGKETNSIEKQIDYVVGSGNHVRAFLHRTSRSALIELPLAWYAENGGTWGMNPGFDRPDHPGFRRNLTNACMFCHNAYPENAKGSNEAATFP